MARRYNQQEKQQALDAVRAGARLSEVAAERAISVSTLRRWVKAAGQPASAPSSTSPAENGPEIAAADPGEVRLVVVDSAGDAGKIARILRNEGLFIELTRLADHPYRELIRDNPVWRKDTYILDLNTCSIGRVFDLLRRSGRELPLVLVRSRTRIECLDDAPEPVFVSTVEVDAMALLGPALEREYQLTTLRNQAARYQAHAQQLLECCQRGFDFATNPVAIIGKRGHDYANAAYLELFGGCTREQIREIPFSSLIDERTRAELGQAFASLHAACTSTSLDVRLPCGSRATIEATRLPGATWAIQLVFRSLQPVRASRPVEAAGQRAATQDARAVAGPVNDGQAVWAARIVGALKDDRLFSMVYQPIVSLDGSASGIYEALLRMHDPDGSEYLPGHFIPAAEKAGLMGRVDRWVIAHAVKLIADQKEGETRLTIFINLSRNSLFDAAFPRWLRATIADAGIQGSQLTLEISRNDVLRDVVATRKALDALRAIGCGALIEDFGGEAGDEKLLQQIAVDYIKIDRTLVHGLDRSDEHLQSIKAIVGAAQRGGVRTIAGFVQEAESVSLLWRCGVDFVQGYFLQHPSRALDYDFGSEEEDQDAVPFISGAGV